MQCYWDPDHNKPRAYKNIASWIGHATSYKSPASLLLQAAMSAYRWPVNLTLQVAVLVNPQMAPAFNQLCLGNLSLQVTVTLLGCSLQVAMLVGPQATM